MPTVILSPFNVLNFPEGGGHFWVYMQYAQALKQLGCEVFWLEQFNSTGSREKDAAKLRPFIERMNRHGLDGKLILYTKQDSADARDYVGLRTSDAEAIFAESDLLLNFHYAIAPELLGRFRRTALVDIDPGLLQFWMSRGQLSVPRHDFYFSTGETVGTAQAKFPDCGVSWIRIHPPIFLDQWPRRTDANPEMFTTVSNWDADDWIVDNGETYENTKRVAFLEFADLPRHTRQPLELALYLRTEKDQAERRELEQHGWHIRPSSEVAGTPEDYQNYVQQSRGEFSCAKRSCVRFQNAWISDRTLCYLASGRPAVVQHTGPSAFLPEGEGLFRFRNLDEAATAFETINADYGRHSRAARKITEMYFDARTVLQDVLSHTLN